MGVEDKQLLPEGGIFEDEILAGTEDADQPTQQMSYRTAARRARRYVTAFADARRFEDPQHFPRKKKAEPLISWHRVLDGTGVN